MDYLRNQIVHFTCINRKNKPPAMPVVPRFCFSFKQKTSYVIIIAGLANHKKDIGGIQNGYE